MLGQNLQGWDPQSNRCRASSGSPSLVQRAEDPWPGSLVPHSDGPHCLQQSLGWMGFKVLLARPLPLSRGSGLGDMTQPILGSGLMAWGCPNPSALPFSGLP